MYFARKSIFTVCLQCQILLKRPMSNHINKSVYISESNDVFTNLAMEDWLYRHTNFEKREILMLWCNNPCVVIGRHQNPWLESNVSELPHITNNEIMFSRRNSGGGTVYHDMGNLNLTFFFPRAKYNRRTNLELISKSIKQKFGVELEISSRHDLIYNGHKISGTAAKLGHSNAYHHCTLLVNVNLNNLRKSLKVNERGIKTNATQSTKSSIKNLTDINPNITVESLISNIGSEYLGTDIYNFKRINPTEDLYPGLIELRNVFVSWDWCFGKTPKFTVSRCFPIPDHFFGDVKHIQEKVQVMIVVDKGIIAEANVNIPQFLMSDSVGHQLDILNSLIGCKFNKEMLQASLDAVQNVFKDKRKNAFLLKCIEESVAFA
ncbi:lipoyltransferase 1, mitochondrial-like [Agrilus planipennis]|uniref:Lipoyltransferase 1, mitochondrial-like n=1 Tax=Agrilus planipennis TaxID=224129 RepID=A0A1W4X7A6_AGRPL|nr:lipoyltransferase 1, mitochondrial-like [Agrilus planipennis]